MTQRHCDPSILIGFILGGIALLVGWRLFMALISGAANNIFAGIVR